MSDRLKGLFSSKWTWTGVILLGVGAVAAAGGLAVAVYSFKRRRQSTEHQSLTSNSSRQLVHASRPPLTGTDEADGFSFDVTTCNEMYEDIHNSLKHLFDNSALHTTFIQYTETSTDLVQSLKSLSEYLNQCKGTLKANRPAPQAKAEIQAIVNALSAEPTTKLQEVEVLTELVGAMLLFPQHIVKKARALAPEKRQTLIELIRSTPNIGKHVFLDKGPFNDPDLQPFMTRMGYSIPSYQTKLSYTASGYEGKLSAGLYLLVGTAKPS